MTNRVTDQTTQNGLIEKFRLEGLLPEMSVIPTIIPVVQVASLQDSLNISEFEKWRSVFGGTKQLIDPADITEKPIFLNGNSTDVVATSHLVSPLGACTLGTGWNGCALPGASVGVPATDGVYRITLHWAGDGGTNLQGSVLLVDQAAFGIGVAKGTERTIIGNYGGAGAVVSSKVLFDFYVVIRETLIANAVVLNIDEATNGNASGSLYVQKLINEIPPDVVFP